MHHTSSAICIVQNPPKLLPVGVDTSLDRETDNSCIHPALHSCTALLCAVVLCSHLEGLLMLIAGGCRLAQAVTQHVHDDSHQQSTSTDLCAEAAGLLTCPTSTTLVDNLILNIDMQSWTCRGTAAGSSVLTERHVNSGSASRSLKTTAAPSQQAQQPLKQLHGSSKEQEAAVTHRHSFFPPCSCSHADRVFSCCSASGQRSRVGGVC